MVFIHESTFARSKVTKSSNMHQYRETGLRVTAKQYSDIGLDINADKCIDISLGVSVHQC